VSIFIVVLASAPPRKADLRYSCKCCAPQIGRGYWESRAPSLAELTELTPARAQNLFHDTDRAQAFGKTPTHEAGSLWVPCEQHVCKAMVQGAQPT
jgi:hypothetical protein